MAGYEHDALVAQHADMADWLAVAAALIAPAPVAIVITAGAEHVVRASNGAFAHLVQWEPQTLPGHPVGDVLCTAQRAGIVALLDGVVRTGEPVVAATQQHAHPVRGTVYWTYTVWPILRPHGRPAGLIIHVRDTTAHEQARRHADQAVDDLRLVNEQLLLAGLREQALATAATHEALHDSLTGLPNRNLLLERVTHALQVTHRDHQPFALLLLDLDRFKAVNDSLGHVAGDAFLQHIAQQLAACVRESDTVARLGGDEFAILLTDVVHISEVLHIADRIQQHVARPVHVQGRDLLISASIGIVLYTPAYTQAEELVRDADTALYRAKALGKAQYVVFDPSMHAQAVALAALYSFTRLRACSPAWP